MFTPPSRTRRVARRLSDLSEQLREMEHRIMSKLSDAVAQLTADDTALEGEVDQLIATVQGIPAVVQAAVTKALSDAGVDDDAATAALATVDTVVQAETAKALAALQPAS